MDSGNNFVEIELQAILKGSKDNIVITDGEGNVLKASPNCLDIYGVEFNQILGRSVYDLEKEDIFSPSITVRVLNEKKECQVLQHTKGERTVLATGMPVFNENGELIRVISFSYDLTEIEELRENYHTLQERMGLYESQIEELLEKEEQDRDVILKSKAIKRVWELVKRVSDSEATVVFLGESGVGKNVFARALHNGSSRASKPFIEVNCSAIPEALFESEMFGYESGSFTGAHKKGKPGMIELADGGTLFLDEIGELPLSMQAKLLKVLQEKTVTRVGGLKPHKIDFRLIASTNQNLEEMARSGSFRQDLYYRLHVIPIEIPPLRKRKDDILLLIQHYLHSFNQKYNVHKHLQALALDELLAYHWPGNVRELENTMERLVLTSEKDRIEISDLPLLIHKQQHNSIEESTASQSNEAINASTYKEAMAQVEKHWLEHAIKQCKTTYEMAELLGLSQSTVVRKLHKYNLNSKMHLNS
ncbi:transcriptional regulator, PAS and AAA-ATPase domains [Alkalihalophilus pseudofirmus OF4]|uniref:HTH-type transcriptional regulatory protein TyrR n=1 Tax=Alkalihalophilus pseudofirmus (strain ATCC BAA-2126 / JCM 17055 / OF4) TaxID=398511 RepID=D3FQ03_ALKPO|nr:sigma 54-interacting transcriptional regulator [Alkalihalophilus pseudofirmus]ADC51296.1 transcriptional regulator, PAS and AAA-ATPase domains [Alkalihalophilus pseudofirmus OF4]